MVLWGPGALCKAVLFWLLFQVPVLADCKGLHFLTSRPPWTPSVRFHVPIITLLCPPLGGSPPSDLSWEKRRKPALGLGSHEDQVTECPGKWRGKALPRRDSRALGLHPRGWAVHRSGTQSRRSGSLRPNQQGLWVYISKELTLLASLWVLGGEGATRGHQNFFIISMLSNSSLPPSQFSFTLHLHWGPPRLSQESHLCRPLWRHTSLPTGLLLNTSFCFSFLDCPRFFPSPTYNWYFTIFFPMTFFLEDYIWYQKPCLQFLIINSCAN